GKPQPVYTIVRKVGGMFRTLSASETTALRPGDTLKVEAPPPTSPTRTVPSGASEKPREKISEPRTKLTLDMNR
ncbi:MAG TPA: hypothetical protein VFO36_05460, partial [Nitrospiraceae bacterium]|nr:hypothetical protein [Nitrospiraceae bacterium]